MAKRQNPVISSHKDASHRITDYLNSAHGIELKPTAALEVVALALGAQNWQALHGMAKKGITPAGSVEAPSPQSDTTVEGAPSVKLNWASAPRISDDDVRKFWRAKGGNFHGPNIETGTMPEASLLPLLRNLAVGTISIKGGPSLETIFGAPDTRPCPRPVDEIPAAKLRPLLQERDDEICAGGATLEERGFKYMVREVIDFANASRWLYESSWVVSRKELLDFLESKRIKDPSQALPFMQGAQHGLLVCRGLIRAFGRDDTVSQISSQRSTGNPAQDEWFRTEQQVLDVIEQHRKENPQSFTTGPTGELYTSNSTLFELTEILTYGRFDMSMRDFRALAWAHRPKGVGSLKDPYQGLLSFFRAVLTLPEESAV